MGVLQGFKVGLEGLEVFHLQYANDMMLVGTSSMDNLLTIKTVLKGFELALAPKVNFVKSCQFEVNGGKTFFNLAAGFLHCKVGSIPFKYLVFPVGVNLK